MLGQQFTRSGDHSCDKGQISTDHQLFWSLIKSTDDLWSTCDRLEPQSGELSPDPRKYSAKNGFWCNPRSSLIRERYFEKMLKVRCFDAVKRIICRIPVCCFPPQYLPCRKYIDFTQTQDFFLCACDDWNGSFSASFLVKKFFIGFLANKVNRCLARYSPRATTTNRPANRAPKKPAWPSPYQPKMPILGQIWSFLGKKSFFLLEKSKVLLPKITKPT